MNVYIITAVGSDPGYTAKRAILHRVSGELNVTLHLPLEQDDESSTPSGVLADLRRADLVIADLSLARPSCYFEVGLAQGLERTVVLISDAGTEIHQVFGRKDVVRYKNLVEYEDILFRLLQ